MVTYFIYHTKKRKIVPDTFTDMFCDVCSFTNKFNVPDIAIGYVGKENARDRMPDVDLEIMDEKELNDLMTPEQLLFSF